MTATSFPYLAIARKYGLSYGEVIRVVESIEKNEPQIVMSDDFNYDIFIEIAQAVEDEWKRRNVQPINQLNVAVKELVYGSNVSKNL